MTPTEVSVISELAGPTLVVSILVLPFAIRERLRPDRKPDTLDLAFAGLLIVTERLLEPIRRRREERLVETWLRSSDGRRAWYRAASAHEAEHRRAERRTNYGSTRAEFFGHLDRFHDQTEALLTARALDAGDVAPLRIEGDLEGFREAGDGR